MCNLLLSKQVVALDKRDVGNMLVPAISLRNF